MPAVSTESLPRKEEEEKGRQYYKCKLQVQAMTCASCRVIGSRCQVQIFRWKRE